jgi:hypothetical protein
MVAIANAVHNTLGKHVCNLLRFLPTALAALEAEG